MFHHFGPLGEFVVEVHGGPGLRCSSGKAVASVPKVVFQTLTGVGTVRVDALSMATAAVGPGQTLVFVCRDEDQSDGQDGSDRKENGSKHSVFLTCSRDLFFFFFFCNVHRLTRGKKTQTKQRDKHDVGEPAAEWVSYYESSNKHGLGLLLPKHILE